MLLCEAALRCEARAVDAPLRSSASVRSTSYRLTMAYRNLSEFIQTLEAQGDLVRISREVSPRLEISEIADRAVKGGGPALLFENVTGSAIPVVINLFGSQRRMLRALELSSFSEWDERLEFFLDPQPLEGLVAKLKAIPKVCGG